MHADCTLWILFLRPGFTRVANLLMQVFQQEPPSGELWALIQEIEELAPELPKDWWRAPVRSSDHQRAPLQISYSELSAVVHEDSVCSTASLAGSRDVDSPVGGIANIVLPAQREDNTRCKGLSSNLSSRCLTGCSGNHGSETGDSRDHRLPEPGRGETTVTTTPLERTETKALALRQSLAALLSVVLGNQGSETEDLRDHRLARLERGRTTVVTTHLQRLERKALALRHTISAIIFVLLSYVYWHQMVQSVMTSFDPDGAMSLLLATGQYLSLPVLSSVLVASCFPEDDLPKYVIPHALTALTVCSLLSIHIVKTVQDRILPAETRLVRVGVTVLIAANTCRFTLSFWRRNGASFWSSARRLVVVHSAVRLCVTTFISTSLEGPSANICPPGFVSPTVSFLCNVALIVCSAAFILPVRREIARITGGNKVLVRLEDLAVQRDHPSEDTTVQLKAFVAGISEADEETADGGSHSTLDSEEGEHVGVDCAHRSVDAAYFEAITAIASGSSIEAAKHARRSSQARSTGRSTGRSTVCSAARSAVSAGVCSWKTTTSGANEEIADIFQAADGMQNMLFRIEDGLGMYCIPDGSPPNDTPPDDTLPSSSSVNDTPPNATPLNPSRIAGVRTPAQHMRVLGAGSTPPTAGCEEAPAFHEADPLLSPPVFAGDGSPAGLQAGPRRRRSRRHAIFF